MSRLEARIAGSDALEALYRFRFAVYVKELAMTDSGRYPDGLLRDGLDDFAANYALFDGDRVAGSLRVLTLARVPDGPLRKDLVDKFALAPAVEAFGPDAIVTTSRFIVAPEYRRGTAVFRLMQRAFSDAFANGMRLNYGDCSPHLLPFYEQMGFRRYTDGFNDTAYGFKLPIVMVGRDRDFMRRARSPLARLLKPEDDDPDARDWFAAQYPDYVNPPTAAFMTEETFLSFLADRIAGDPAHHMSLLAGLGPADQQRFLASATTVKVNSGDRIVRKGDQDGTLYALLSGIAEVTNPAGGLPLATFGAGDTFGEIGFLAEEPRTADVVARTAGEVLVLTGGFFDRFRNDQPKIAGQVLFNLARLLAGRLAETSRRVVTGTQTGEGAPG